MFRTLLVDNYDSYTYNLYHQIAAVTSVPPVVVANDRTTLSSVKRLVSKGEVHNIVVSPGPGTPAVAADVGVVPDLFQHLTDTPILGVCLGHQALSHVHGGSVVRAPEPCHGRLSDIEHSGHMLFKGIPSGRNSGFRVVRYHSLMVQESDLPTELQPICWTAGGHVPLSIGEEQLHASAVEDKLLMGVAHKTQPHYGIQYHPESVATCFGDTLLKNYVQLAAQFSKQPLPATLCAPLGLQESRNGSHAFQALSDEVQLQVVWSQVTDAAHVQCLQLMDTMEWADSQNTFWLDSERSSRSHARFSFLGGPGGQLWRRITFQLPRSSRGVPSQPARNGAAVNGSNGAEQEQNHTSASSQCQEGLLTEVDASGAVVERRCHFRSWLRNFMKRRRLKNLEKADQLPFNFQGGLVGYLGYEMKAESTGDLVHDSRHPDAAFFFADRFIVLDHQEDSLYIAAVHTGESVDARHAQEWIESTENKILQLQKSRKNVECTTDKRTSTAVQHGEQFKLSRSKSEYIADIQACMAELHAGNSYEICLTNLLSGNIPATRSWEFYKCLRSTNAAPYSAWMHFGLENAVVCCSSPERFLKLDRQGVLEARPIKGTAARVLDDPERDAAAAKNLASSEKDRAENLMIVDLLRNDLGCICEPCSVDVPGLMQVESFASVHQLVSTVRGTLSSTYTPVDALFEVFPGGSMTGAPKVRSMQIIDRLEDRPRGVYSGCLGYFSLNGTFDFNIVIRTAVFSDEHVSVGAGGAIVVQSDEVGEFEEMELKAERLLNAFRMLDSLQSQPSYAAV